MTDKTNKCA